MSPSAPIEGFCDPRFAAVRAAFEENFRSNGEVGAAVALFLDGKPMVDLWGGWADGARTKPWRKDTIVNMNSVAKEVTAILLMRLVDRGQVDLEAPVARYWPEFAAAGKDKLTVLQLMAHLSGLPSVEPVQRGIAYHWDRMVAALASQPPQWPIGTPCYHAFTYGHLIGEIIRRVSGQSVGQFLRAELCEPFGFDYHIGLTPEEDARRAEFLRDPNHANMRGIEKLETVFARSFAVVGVDEDFNSPDWRFRELPSVNGHGNARAIAKLCAALANGGSLDGFTVLSRKALDAAVTEQWWAEEKMGRIMRMGLGLLLNGVAREGGFNMGPNPESFGFFGAGGHVGIADPVAKIGFCYTMNAMNAARDFGHRANAMIEAAFQGA
jgi:CubicO group peptidase (beta-lactamase class C family)